MKQRRILLLGGTAIQIPLILAAKEKGLYVITCDNRPDNPGHAYSDEYHNISITDKDAVLALAKELQVDAVVNYILEAGIQACAYAQEEMGKPTSTYASVHTLSNKHLFRQFLKNNGFKVPCVYQPSDAIDYPVVVKPADMWGSRGFTKVETAEDLPAAIDYAMDNSLHGEVIIEEFIEPWHAPVEGDGFAVNGKLTAHLFGDCYPDPQAPNPITPVLYCFPSEKPIEVMQRIDHELQRLMDILHMQTNAYNVEVRVNEQGEVYLMEVAPRNGGNALTDVLALATGMDAMRGTLRAALDEDCSDITDAPSEGYWCNYVVHSNEHCIYEGMWYDEAFEKNNLVAFDCYIKEGDEVQPYTGTNHSIGMLMARFNSRDQQHLFMQSPESFFRVKKRIL